MAEKEGHGGLGVIGAAAGGLLLLVARFGDDCARTGAHVAPLADDAARVGVEAEGVARLAGEASVVGRVGDDTFGALVREHGLDVADLLSAAAELAPGAPDAAAAPLPHPRLVVAHAENPPDPGPVDPLVLLVDPLAEADRAALIGGCATAEHRCVVLECADAACVEAWRAVWEELGRQDALVGQPDAVANALLLAGTAERRLVGSHLTAGTLGPTGVSRVERTITARGAEPIGG